MNGPARTPCLGDRVAALADGSLRADVRDRALAHTLTCPTCLLALEAERCTVAALRSLAPPAPSPRLVGQLIALGGVAGPMPPRRPAGPGMPQPEPVPVLGRQAPWPVTTAGGTRGSLGRGPRRPRPRAMLAVAAGVVGVGLLTAGMFVATDGRSPAPSAHLLVRTHPLTSPVSSRPFGAEPAASATPAGLRAPAGGWSGTAAPSPGWAMRRWTPSLGSSGTGASTGPAPSVTGAPPGLPHPALAATADH